MDKDQMITRGLRAQQILDDDIVKEAKEHIESELWRMFKETSPSDAKSLEFIKGMQYIHGKYWAFFANVIANGKIEKAKIEAHKRSLKERVFG